MNTTTHFLAHGLSGEYACGADAIGRRNTRTDTDPTNTTCPRCTGTEAFFNALEAKGGTISRGQLARTIAAATGASLPKAAEIVTEYTRDMFQQAAVTEYAVRPAAAVLEYAETVLCR